MTTAKKLKNGISYLPSEIPDDGFLRFKYSLVSMLESRIPLNEKTEKLLALTGRDKIGLRGFIPLLLDLECIDYGWKERIKRWNEDDPQIQDHEEEMCRILIYLLFRNLNDSGIISEQIYFCLLMTGLIYALAAEDTVEDAFPEILRLYSQEIEYSEENMFRIIEKIRETE